MERKRRSENKKLFFLHDGKKIILFRRLESFAFRCLVVVVILLLLLDEPVLDDGGRLAGISAILTLNLDGHVLVFLQAGGKVGLLGRLGGFRKGEGGDLADGIGVLNGGGLVGLELLEVELLDEVGCRKEVQELGKALRIVYDGEGWGTESPSRAKGAIGCRPKVRHRVDEIERKLLRGWLGGCLSGKGAAGEDS
jgi:hypothetical protein